MVYLAKCLVGRKDAFTLGDHSFQEGQVFRVDSVRSAPHVLELADKYLIEKGYKNSA